MTDLRNTDIRDLVAADVMQKSMIYAEPHERLADLDRRFVESNVSGVPVVEKGRLVGFISRSDFARVPVLMEALAGYANDEVRQDGPPGPGTRDESVATKTHGFWECLERLTVKDAMPTDVVQCSPQSPIREVATEIVNRHVHRVVVVEDERPVGIVSCLDIVKILSES